MGHISTESTMEGSLPWRYYMSNSCLETAIYIIVNAFLKKEQLVGQTQFVTVDHTFVGKIQQKYPRIT